MLSFLNVQISYFFLGNHGVAQSKRHNCTLHGKENIYVIITSELQNYLLLMHGAHLSVGVIPSDRAAAVTDRRSPSIMRYFAVCTKPLSLCNSLFSIVIYVITVFHYIVGKYNCFADIRLFAKSFSIQPEALLHQTVVELAFNYDGKFICHGVGRILL